ncbi:MAG: RagB/SusD family nutrient uptake outer membrane protein [Mangrovibacterium sp.]
MKKIIIILLIISGTFGCDSFLDVVPANTPSLDDAFSNRAMMERSLFSCYSYLPDPTDPFHYPAYYTSKGEFEYGTSTWIYPRPAPAISRGEQNSNSPLLDYWSGANGAQSMFDALRTCNIFLEGASIPRDISEDERQRWIAEVKFLKAYYHFFLLQLYGPIPLIKENFPLSASPEEIKVFREPVDECIDYIVELINEAVPYLPLNIINATEEAGRITQPIALAVKAKALVWDASPLFNGNPDYAGWVDSRGKQLVSSAPSKEKWERAVVALRNAIDTCHLAGHRLFEYSPNMHTATYNMSDSLLVTMTIRKAITERWNSGVIWSSTEAFGDGKGGMSAFAVLGNMQRNLFPIMYTTDANKTVGYCPASFEMAELFYTKNGVPIEEDKDWNFEDRYKLKYSTKADNHHLYIASGEATAYLNFNREARFYASLGFDRGYFEIATAAVNGGASFSPYLKLRQSEPGNLANPTGYYVKKLVAFESSCSQNDANKNYSGYDYRFPIIRLSDLYLMYSEALNEMKDKPDDEVYNWIDQVREVAGLKGVVESWQSSVYPDRPTDKDEMRKIIQQERLIELAFEGQRFWDVRRWKLADSWWTMIPKGWNRNGRTAEDYYTLLNIGEARKFTVKDYLWPIRISDLRVNNNLVQTYGW